MSKSTDQSPQGTLRTRRRRLRTRGAWVTATVLTGVLAWALVVQGPEGDGVDDAPQAETDTSQSTGETSQDGQSSGHRKGQGQSSGEVVKEGQSGGEAGDAGARGQSASSLQQSSDDPSPDVSSVVVGPGEDPAASENLSNLTANDVEVNDEIADDDLKKLDEQVAEAQSAQDSPEAVAEMESALDDYSNEQESLLVDPEEIEVEDNDPVVLDDLESDAEQLNDEIAQSI